METIVMYVLMLSGTWVRYDYVEDVRMERIETVDDCTREATLLKLRRGDVLSHFCIGWDGKPNHHLITPPYNWPEIQTSIDGSQEICITTACLLEQSDERNRKD